MMHNLVFLFLITFVNSQPHNSFSNSAYDEFSSSNSLDQCVPITSTRPCASMPWNMTIFPNLAGHIDTKGNIQKY